MNRGACRRSPGGPRLRDARRWPAVGGRGGDPGAFGEGFPF
ncbi:hypothetical protein C7S16_3643 [Burkholderia thailandensis]|uniref:Uncharacterized protein n=1 Tax=Burkholderia thailandensis TaxID=57975 RepID=A0AAW9D3D3_BURTH|nr:hypothetical protein [Burkholderia thailandensis]MDW9256413.1 hypothetical protein [Burkholderia thailandensis]